MTLIRRILGIALGVILLLGGVALILAGGCAGVLSLMTPNWSVIGAALAGLIVGGGAVAGGGYLVVRCLDRLAGPRDPPPP